MIQTKKELKFYLAADRMMNRGTFKRSIKSAVKEILFPDFIMDYLVAMRKFSYYEAHRSLVNFIPLLYNMFVYNRLGVRLGFTIDKNVVNYGLVIPHHGTIVVGSTNVIGKFTVLHTSTCITANGKTIGDGLYLSTGAKITSQIILGDNVMIGANSVVNKSFENGNVMIAGAPASIKKTSSAWYGESGKMYERVEQVKFLKTKMEL